jgi:D-alanyl-D-alanine dipeptidase
MKYKIFLLPFALTVIGATLWACQQTPAAPQEPNKTAAVMPAKVANIAAVEEIDTPKTATAAATPVAAPKKEAAPVPKGWVDVASLDPTIAIDIRYATTNNFMEAKIYDCPACFLREEVAKAILAAHKDLQTQGFGGLKMFDCYRPAPYQQRLWDKKPDARFVTNPKKGSMHSKGGAVDLTIIDTQGNELDMGTPYDYFGEKGYSTYTNLPPEVLKNRRTLTAALKKVGFKDIRTEWWHYAYIKKQYGLADWLWDCNN